MVDRLSERGDDETMLLAQGQAGFWLSESLILALVEGGVLDKDRVLEAIDIVIAGKQAGAAEGGNPEIERAAVALLSAVSTSVAAVRTGSTEAKRISAGRRVRQRNAD